MEEQRIPSNWQILQAVTNLRKELEDHIKDEAQKQAQLLELLAMFERSRGALWFVRMLVFVGAPFGAFLLWARDHIK